MKNRYPFVSIFFASGHPAEIPVPTPIVEIEHGRIQGILHHGVSAFKGILYGTPRKCPVRGLRSRVTGHPNNNTVPRRPACDEDGHARMARSSRLNGCSKGPPTDRTETDINVLVNHVPPQLTQDDDTTGALSCG